jgi:hypothetical protein
VEGIRLTDAPFIQNSARYCLIIGMYCDLERHMGWKAESSQMTPIEGNDQNYLVGESYDCPHALKEPKKDSLSSWDRRVISDSGESEETRRT